MPLEISQWAKVTVVCAEPSGEAPLEWDNTYEINISDGLTDANRANAICLAFAAMQSELLMPPYVVDRVLLVDATYEGPYDPSKIVKYEYGLVGKRPEVASIDVQSDSLLPLNNVLRVTKRVQYGYPGAILLRGYLTEQDIVSSAVTGKTRLVSPASNQQELSGAFSGLFTALDTAEARMVLLPEELPPDDWRDVTGLIVGKPGTKQLRNKVKARYGQGVLGQINRALDSIKDNEAALNLAKEALKALPFLVDLLT